MSKAICFSPFFPVYFSTLTLILTLAHITLLTVALKSPVLNIKQESLANAKISV